MANAVGDFLTRPSKPLTEHEERKNGMAGYPWGEIPHPPMAGGCHVNETARSTRQKSHFSINIAHNYVVL